LFSTILFLPLLAGYLFIWYFRPLHFKIKSRSGHHLVFISAQYGVVLFLISILLLTPFLGFPDDHIQSYFTWLNQPKLTAEDVKNWGQLFGLPWLMPSLLSIGVGVGIAKVFNLFYRKLDDQELLYENLQSDWNSLELKLYQSLKINENTLLQQGGDLHFSLLVLKSNKCYIGVVMKTPKLSIVSGEKKYIEFLPFLSGYRNNDDKIMHITTNYAEKILNHIDENPIQKTTEEKTLNDDSLLKFIVVLPVDNIESFRFFDLDSWPVLMLLLQRFCQFNS